MRYLLKSVDKPDKIFAFAPKKVLTELVDAKDENGADLTHYQYFKERLKILGLKVENLLTEDTATRKGSVYPYDEVKMPETLNAWKPMGQIDKENFLQIVDRYFRIKQERNDCAHASFLHKKN